MVLLLAVSALSATSPGTEPISAATPAFLVATPAPLESAAWPVEPVVEGTPWGAIGLHYGIGVMATAGGLAASYGLAVWAGHQGNGLIGPIIGLLIGALLPPLLISTAQWGIWEWVFPDRDRYWPSLIAAFACHLAVFIGSVLGGISLHDNSGVGVILLEAFALPAATTTTAYLTRYDPEVLTTDSRAESPVWVGTPHGRVMVPLFTAVF